jgi:transcriptional regulator with XRE-family HTH domain
MSKMQLKSNLTPNQNIKLRREFTIRLAERLREIRKSKDMTQQQLAESSGLHLTYIGHLELAKYHPTVFVMWKISKALGVSIDELTNF